ncbi:DUF1289 domain-containing protein [Paraburkholderia terrae]|nr:DUF1289 domain-containing protein [Paraburkholderia terrae]
MDVCALDGKTSYCVGCLRTASPAEVALRRRNW